MLVAASGVAAAAGLTGEYKGYPVVNVVVNDKPVYGEVPGINMDGTTLVPLKVVSEALGGTVGWDQATSTASVKTAAAPSVPTPAAPTPQEQAKKKQVQQVDDLYDRVAAYIDSLATVRERIRIAKEYYDIKKNDQYFSTMTEIYWRAFDDTYNGFLVEISSVQMNEAKQAGILSEGLTKALDSAHNAMTYYKYAYENYTRYITLNQGIMLDFYISSLATAFDEEVKVKASFTEARKQFVGQYYAEPLIK
jgi:hypothetical protein